MTLISYAVLLFVLIMLSAFFSSSETAFSVLSLIKVRQLLKEKAKHAKVIYDLKRNKNRLLVTILVGNNLVNNFASSLATALAVSLCGDSGIGIATIFSTVFIIIFGEIVPKTVASYRPVSVAQKSALFLRLFEIILRPFSAIFSLITAGITFIAAKLWPDTTPIVTEEELKMLIELGNQEGTLEAGEKEMMNKIFEFTDLHVNSIMTNRLFVKGVSLEAGYKEAIESFRKSGFSRLPVFDGSIDSICGLVHYKDVLFAGNDADQFSVASIMHQPLFVPETKLATALLHEFIHSKQNFAVAVDENGCNSGIITLDDLLSAVFGHITDEYEDRYTSPENRIEFVSSKEFRVPGDISLSDFNVIFKFNLESDYYQTLGGWMLEHFDALPPVGSAIRSEKATFIVEEQHQRCIKKVRVKFSIAFVNV